MPLETKKVLWTVLCVVLVLVISSGIALALAFPRGSSAGAPATIAAVAPPRTSSPEEYMRALEPAPVPKPTSETSGTSGSDIIIVYGEKPAVDSIPTTATAISPAPVAIKPYTPAPASPQLTTKPAAAQSAAASAVAKAKPATQAKPKIVDEYWIQAAAFTSRSRADDLQRDLASKGLSTLITVKDLDGVTWYRVRIGPYGSEREAKGWLDTIRVVAGCSEAYVSKQTVQRSS
ncbi:MAG: SPOR domain-containing protein [Spirochaetia bacterium]|jgi:DedD protein|nr:SPOR domain-containing protein [Spirochaetia bacterium]